MKKIKKGIFITSLNSKRLQDSINNKNNFHFNNMVDELDVFVFDTMEILNSIYFTENNAFQQKEIIENIIHKLEENFIAVDTIKRSLLRCSQIRNELKPFLISVYQEFYSNLVFERHCKNQVFQNLQPKLRRLSIHDNKSDLIELLIPFLIYEISLYLFIFNNSDYIKIFGLEVEMNIIKAIKNHKYPAFDKYLNADVDYIKILTE